MRIDLPKDLPETKIYQYLEIKKKGYDEYIKLIYSLGGLITINQFERVVRIVEPNLKDSYISKKASIIIKKLAEYKVIEMRFLNKYKYFYLKRFGKAIATNDYNIRRSNQKLLSNSGIKIAILKSEHYIKTRDVISLDNMNKHLIILTKEIERYKLKYPELDYDLPLLQRIIDSKGRDISFMEDKLNNLDDGNLLKLIWIDLKSIYDKLALQNQTVSKKPFYYKMICKNNKLYLHYIPEIIFFDVHNKKYYSDKLDVLFNQFINIKSNHTRDMKKIFKVNNTLGYDGYNHIGYIFKLLGYNKNGLLQKQKHINNYIEMNDNPNSMMVRGASVVHYDISKYFTESSSDNSIFNAIDDKIDELLGKKI
ncbi:MAG: hypothetical protein ACLS2V_12870 [Clostridium paraputrificum]|uniref:hypothetical protein n=1 Tax=Clostridium sp. TaxID=1506 RepID=UPI0025C6F36E|nr:hypothetical protein [Clostridium sp.]MBS5926237.1 hypothetical protein [Clostridium sp.]